MSSKHYSVNVVMFTIFVTCLCYLLCLVILVILDKLKIHVSVQLYTMFLYSFTR